MRIVSDIVFLSQEHIEPKEVVHRKIEKKLARIRARQRERRLRMLLNILGLFLIVIIGVYYVQYSSQFPMIP